MPFIANTPESLVARADSKNPATTCRGITAGGRPCRRPLAAAPGSYSRNSSNSSNSRPFSGKLRVDDPRDERLYCWQHKEQASLSTHSSPGPRTAAVSPVREERTSLDTLADRLGLLGVNSGRSRKGSRPGIGAPSSSRPAAGWTDDTKRRPSRSSHHGSSGTVLACCCFNIPLEEAPLPQPRPRPRPQPRPLQPSVSSNPGSTTNADNRKQPQPQPQPHPPRPAAAPGSASQHTHRYSLPGSSPSARRPSTASSTAHYLSLIPPTASPQTASALLAELARPVSQVDEPGYIYMFWLTPVSQPATPPADAARALLAPPPLRADGRGQRRASDVVASFAAGSGGGSGSSGSNRNGNNHNNNRNSNSNSNSKLLLKIGRANNVQRRLNEWTRQCGYNLSLLRYYPYIPSSGGSPGTPSGPIPRKMPHSHKVERLIHIELAGVGLRVTDGDKCGACGREHREWFQVEASRKAVTRVDETIRRWVDWDEGRL